MPVSASVRLDIWLDVACLFRTRAEAQRACRNGKVDVNGVTAKPHREVRAGDTLRIGRPFGRTQTVVVKGTAKKDSAGNLSVVASGLYVKK